MMKKGIVSICICLLLLGTTVPLTATLTFVQTLSTMVPKEDLKQQEYLRQRELVFGCSGDVDKLDPADITDQESSARTDNIFEGLVTYQPSTTTIQPCLATSWTISKDGATLTFHLRHNVTFHDGTAFNASAVMFSFDRQFNQSNPYHQYGDWAYWGYMFTNIKHVTATDEYTVTITLDHPDSSILTSLAMFTTAIVSPTNAKKWLDNAYKHPCGTGPFRFVEWVPDDHITLTANQQYWQGPPQLDTLVFQVIKDPAARLQALQNDTIQGMEFPDPASFDTIRADQNLSLLEGPDMSVGYLAMNNGYGYNDTNGNGIRDPNEPWVKTPGYFKPLTNRKVRQAINYAINKTAIINLYKGTADIAKNGMPPYMLGYNDNIVDYPYDPAKARTLLAKAGYQHGFNTTLWVMPVYRPYMYDPVKIAEAIQSDLAAVGIDVQLYQIDWATYLALTQAGEHPMCLLGWTGDNGDPDNFMNVLYGANQCTLGTAGNVAFYRNPFVQRLFTAAIHTYHLWQRAILYKIAQRIIHRDAPFVYLAYGNQHLVFRTTVKGFIMNPSERYFFYPVYIGPATVFEKFYTQKGTKDATLDTHQQNEAPCGHLVGPNLAPNPSFEQGDTMPTGWTYDPNSTGIYHWDSACAHSGMKSIGVLNLTNGTSDDICWTSDFIPVDYVTNTYIFSGWYKFIGTPTTRQSAILSIKEYDENYRPLGGGGYVYGYTPEWKKSQNDTTNTNDPIIKYVKIELIQEYWGENEPDPSVEVRFDDIYFGILNTAPNTPNIVGKTHGKIKTLYTFSFTATDPDQDKVAYQIYWGDNTTQITGHYASGEEANITHIWGVEGTYIISAKATDEHGKQSQWATLIVTLPCTNTMPMDSFWRMLFERFPHAFPLLRHRLGYY